MPTRPQRSASPTSAAIPLERVRRWCELAEFCLDNPRDCVDVLCDLSGELEDALEDLIRAEEAEHDQADAA